MTSLLTTSSSIPRLTTPTEKADWLAREALPRSTRFPEFVPESRWPRIAKPWPIRSLTRKCSAAEVPLKIRSSGRYCYTKTWSTPTLCDFTIFSVMVSRRHSFYYYYLFSHECMGNWAYAAHASHNLIHEASDEVSETKVCKIKCDIHLLTKGVGLMSFVKEAVVVLCLMGSFKMTIGPSLLFLRIYPSRSNVVSHIFFSFYLASLTWKYSSNSWKGLTFWFWLFEKITAPCKIMYQEIITSASAYVSNKEAHKLPYDDH